MHLVGTLSFVLTACVMMIYSNRKYWYWYRYRSRSMFVFVCCQTSVLYLPVSHIRAVPVLVPVSVTNFYGCVRFCEFRFWTGFISTPMDSTGNHNRILSDAMHRPKAFVAAALQFGWLPDSIIRDLIQLIASYACTPGTCNFLSVVHTGTPVHTGHRHAY